MPKQDAALTGEQLDQAVDQWFDSHFRNSVLSRDTSIYNAAFTAMGDLKARLRQVTGIEQAPSPAPQQGDEEQ